MNKLAGEATIFPVAAAGEAALDPRLVMPVSSQSAYFVADLLEAAR